MATGVYCILNTVVGKIYVGSSVNIEERWWNHKYYLRLGTHINRNLQGHWNKYGEEAFEFHVLAECEVGQQKIEEVKRIQVLELAFPNMAYNVEIDPEAAARVSKISSETAKRLWADQWRKSQAELWANPEFREKMRLAAVRNMAKLWTDEEFRKSHSERKKRAWTDPEYRKKMTEGVSQRNREANPGTAHWGRIKGTPEYSIRNLKMQFGKYGKGRTFEQYILDTKPELHAYWQEQVSLANASDE